MFQSITLIHIIGLKIQFATLKLMFNPLPAIHYQCLVQGWGVGGMEKESGPYGGLRAQSEHIRD